MKKNQDVLSVVNKEGLILLVDDDDSLLKFFKIHLNKFFPKIFVAESASEAMNMIDTKPIDLIVCDYAMPKMNGLSLAKKVRKIRIDIPVLFISGTDLSKEILDDIKMFSDGLLKKPFSVEDFNRFIVLGLEIRENFKLLLSLMKENKKNLLRTIIKDLNLIDQVVLKKQDEKIMNIYVQQLAKIFEKIQILQE